MQPVYSCLHFQFLCHVLKALFLYQNSPKIKLFLQKNAKFSSAGGSAPTPVPPAAEGFAPRPLLAYGGWGLRPHTPKTAPPIANSWLRARTIL